MTGLQVLVCGGDLFCIVEGTYDCCPLHFPIVCVRARVFACPSGSWSSTQAASLNAVFPQIMNYGPAQREPRLTEAIPAIVSD